MKGIDLNLHIDWQEDGQVTKRDKEAVTGLQGTKEGIRKESHGREGPDHVVQDGLIRGRIKQWVRESTLGSD